MRAPTWRAIRVTADNAVTPAPLGRCVPMVLARLDAEPGRLPATTPASTLLATSPTAARAGTLARHRCMANQFAVGPAALPVTLATNVAGKSAPTCATTSPIAEPAANGARRRLWARPPAPKERVA